MSALFWPSLSSMHLRSLGLFYLKNPKVMILKELFSYQTVESVATPTQQRVELKLVEMVQIPLVRPAITVRKEWFFHLNHILSHLTTLFTPSTCHRK
uniref:Uncharacterized protein n=1 Tax=Salix viminalis TaxID=40686 RepID=A0A6N2M6B0_SALVM